MANQSINDFINGFKGGTRLNRFAVEGSIQPGIPGNANKVTAFHIRSAALPEATVGPIAINHRGRTVTYPGDRIYQPWQITVLDDHAGGNNDPENLFKMFHDWHDRINSHTGNKTTFTQDTGQNPNSLFSSSWIIRQYEVNCDTPLPGRTFTLFNIWPIAVGPLVLDMSQDNVLGSFAVTLMYSHYTYDGAPHSSSTGV
jgi:hypothetical protein